MSIIYIFLLILIPAFLTFPKRNNLRKVDEISEDIVILHLNDVHCGINDIIGYDGFVLYRRELQQKYKYIITVDVGDHIHGSSLGAISDGAAIIKIMNKIKFDAVALGKHEFDYRMGASNKLEQNITSGYICSNFCYKKNKTLVYEPYKIISAGDKTIGFIGVLTPLTFSKTYLSSLKDEDGESIYDFLVNDGKEELYNTVQKYIDELRNEKHVNYVILLSHMGINAEEYPSEDLLSNLTGVDAVFDGHTHQVYSVTSKDKNGKNIHITQAGTKLESIGQLIIKSDGSLIAETISEVPEPDNNFPNVKKVVRSNVERWVDENMYNFINEVYDEYSDKEIIGISDYDLIIQDTDDSHDIYCRYQECTVGNLITDAMAKIGQGDFSIIVGGSVRGNINKGIITQDDIINALPWYNKLVIKELPGQTILDALEFWVRNYPEGFNGFPQISSKLSFTFNPDITSTVETDANGIFIGITGERRIIDVKINGKTIDLNKKYSVVFFEFLANGGDGYEMFNNYLVSREALSTDTQSLSDFIKYELNGNIPESYAQTQGRISISRGISSNLNSNSDNYNRDILPLHLALLLYTLFLF